MPFLVATSSGGRAPARARRGVRRPRPAVEAGGRRRRVGLLGVVLRLGEGAGGDEGGGRAGGGGGGGAGGGGGDRGLVMDGRGGVVKEEEEL